MSAAKTPTAPWGSEIHASRSGCEPASKEEGRGGEVPKGRPASGGASVTGGGGLDHDPEFFLKNTTEHLQNTP
jgi:hypothetical protein